MSKTERRQLTATVYNEHSHTRLDEVTEWLNANYVIRVNLLDRSKVSLSPTEDCTFHYEYPVTEDDILIHAFAEEVNIPRSLLKAILASPNHMQSFNPIKDYLDSLRGKYKGPSQIDMLCASLHTPKENKDTIARVSHILRKWLIATAACALGIRQNDVALGLVGDKAGIGKTSFFEMLVPPCLNEYYQVAQKDERLFSMPNGFTQRFILNFDEFAAIGKHNEELFKMYMSANEIEIKRPGSRYAEKAPRVASCCFTSNKNQRMGGFISKPDAGLMRRLAVIEVDFIDDNRKRLDVDQLWAEAVMLLDGNYDPAWTQQEYRQFVEENRQYVIETNALRLIRIYYRKPEEGEECEFMTAMEVVLQLKKEKKISSAMQQVNEVTVGQALTALGYRYYIRRFPGKSPYHGYDIVPLYDVQQKNLVKCGDYDTFMEVCHNLHADEEDPELMYQDYECLPSAWYSESGIDEDTFNKIMEYADMDEDDRDAYEEFVDSFGNDSFDSFKERYIGKWDSEKDFAEHIVDECYNLDDMMGYLASYFDYDAYARDLFIDDFYFTDGYVFRR